MRTTVTERINIIEMMRQAALEAGEPTPPPSSVHPMAQAIELQSRWSSVYGTLPTIYNRLVPGHLVKAKAGLSMLHNRPIMIIWRWLDTKNNQDIFAIEKFLAHSIPLDLLDCMVGFFGEGSTIVAMPHSSRLLQRYEQGQGA